MRLCVCRVPGSCSLHTTPPRRHATQRHAKPRHPDTLDTQALSATLDGNPLTFTALRDLPPATRDALYGAFAEAANRAAGFATPAASASASGMPAAAAAAASGADATSDGGGLDDTTAIAKVRCALRWPVVACGLLRPLNAWVSALQLGTWQRVCAPCLYRHQTHMHPTAVTCISFSLPTPTSLLRPAQETLRAIAALYTARRAEVTQGFIRSLHLSFPPAAASDGGDAGGGGGSAGVLRGAALAGLIVALTVVGVVAVTLLLLRARRWALLQDLRKKLRFLDRASAAPGYGPDTTLMLTDVQDSTQLWCVCGRACRKGPGRGGAGRAADIREAAQAAWYRRRRTLLQCPASPATPSPHQLCLDLPSPSLPPVILQPLPPLPAPAQGAAAGQCDGRCAVAAQRRLPAAAAALPRIRVPHRECRNDATFRGTACRTRILGVHSGR